MHVFDNRRVPSHCDQGGVLLGRGLLVGVSGGGCGGDGGGVVGDRRVVVVAAGRVRLFFLLEHQGGVRAAGAGEEGVVSCEPQTEKQVETGA